MPWRQCSEQMGQYRRLERESQREQTGGAEGRQRETRPGADCVSYCLQPTGPTAYNLRSIDLLSLPLISLLFLSPISLLSYHSPVSAS